MLDYKLNYFDKLFLDLKERERSYCPYLLVIEAYLYRTPSKKRKAKPQLNRDESFWNSKFVFEIPLATYKTDIFILALARYFAQDIAKNFNLMTKIFAESPVTIRTAIRRSQLVLKKEHAKWNEIRTLANQNPHELVELIATCEAFQSAHKDRLNLVEEYSEPLKPLTLFEFMSFSAAYSFKHLKEQAISFDGGGISADSQLRALTELMQWKLRHVSNESFSLNDIKISQSLKKYHAPLIFPSNEDSSRAEAFLHIFSQLVQAQVELDEFLSQSVHPFCFDDSLLFSVKNECLTLTHLDSDLDDTWERNGNRQKMLRGYWFNLAVNDFISSGMAFKQIGTSENHESNQFAYVKAIASLLELQKVYGFTSSVTISSGFNVNLFQALLSQELMISFYLKDYIQAFDREYAEVGDWQKAIGLVTLKGLATGQNRFPITWSLWKDKINNIVGWTVSDDFPSGNINAAKAILDFWCLDLKKRSALLKGSPTSKLQQLTEKPIFKIGSHCVQLPWLMSAQVSSVNAVNNLRRFANQRSSLKDETTRIENQLGDEFKLRGFSVLKNFTAKSHGGVEAGEIDLICAIDNIVIVIEVKSTYCRTTKSEIFYHRDRTLRKAGIQVRKKVDAIKRDLQVDEQLRKTIKLTSDTPNIVGLIADTSIEFDHEYFAGFLKVTIEELLIALADNAHFLCNQEQKVLSSLASGEQVSLVSEAHSLYKNGFSGKEFLDVIEHSRVWEGVGHLNGSKA
ncbi:NERD domain-containing protein [Vibrio breoganii]